MNLTLRQREIIEFVRGFSASGMLGFWEQRKYRTDTKPPKARPLAM
jgi:hypothetical protein